MENDTQYLDSNSTPQQNPSPLPTTTQAKEENPSINSGQGKSKGGLIILVLLGILVLTGAVGFGGYLLGKNAGKKEAEEETTTTTTILEVTDPYEGWETYENNEYGFSFRYPLDWELEEVNNSTTEWQAVQGDSSTGVTIAKNNSTVTIVINPYIEDFRSVIRGNVKDITINGKKFKRCLYHYADPNKEYINGKPQLGELVFGHVMEEKYYDVNDWSDWTESQIDLGNKDFLILYDFPEGSTYEESKDLVEEMDKSIETLSLI